MILKTPDTPLVEIKSEILRRNNLKLFVKREDLVDKHISGNKWFKLKYNLIEAERLGYKKILTFGGAYSNHIYATAAAGKKFGFETIGIIRGEEHLPLNPTLTFAQSCGMKLFYLNRSAYRNKYSSELLNQLKNIFGEFYLIPEGGSNHLAVKGCSEIIKRINVDFDFICTASGTGGTLAGLALGLNNNAKALGFSVLKGATFLNDNVRNFLSDLGKDDLSNWQIIFDYHFDGYAKVSNELLNFCFEFKELHDIQIEPIYTGKMFYGIFDLAQKNFFPKNSVIVALHSGGLQGLEGLKQRGLLKDN